MGVFGVALRTPGQQQHRRGQEMNVIYQPGQQIPHVTAES